MTVVANPHDVAVASWFCWVLARGWHCIVRPVASLNQQGFLTGLCMLQMPAEAAEGAVRAEALRWERWGLGKVRTQQEPKQSQHPVRPMHVELQSPPFAGS